MAGYKYFTVITDKGRELIANAITSETPLDFTEMAIGDSNGLSYDPVSDMAALKHEVYRAPISSMKINTDDANIMEFEFVVPSTSGGYYVREAGLFASDGSLIALSRLPEQYKADMSEGAGSSMTVRILVAISSEAQLYINVPESINYATQTYVAEEFKKHKAEENPHTQYVLVETYSEKITELENSLAGKAEGTHNHDGVYSAANHNHDGVYSKTNHTHSNFMPMATKTSGIGEFTEVRIQDYSGRGLKEYKLPDEGVYFYFLIADYYTPVEKKYTPVVSTGIKPNVSDWFISYAYEEGVDQISGFLWRIG